MIIVGLSTDSLEKAKLYSEAQNGEPLVSQVPQINAYLVPGSEIYIQPRSSAPPDRPAMYWGNKPTDGGFLILTQEEVRHSRQLFQGAERFLKAYYGSTEFIKGNPRACIWIEDSERKEAENIPFLRQRMESVREFRASSKAKETRPAAAYPHRFRQIQGSPGTQAVIVPIHTSEARDYLPVGLLDKDAIVSNAAYALYDADHWCLSIIASRLHLVWIATVSGKIKTDFRYSNTLGWHTFPIPTLTEKNKVDLERSAQEILLAREAHFPATIADLYDPEDMPANLRAAHERNDEVLERIYIGRRFKNDSERLEKLFELYTKMTTKPQSTKTKMKA